MKNASDLSVLLYKSLLWTQSGSAFLSIYKAKRVSDLLQCEGDNQGHERKVSKWDVLSNANPT